MSTTGKLTNEQKTILNGFTEVYKVASRKERKSVIKEALTALFPAVSDNDTQAGQHRKEQISNIQKVGSFVKGTYKDTDSRNLQAASNISQTTVAVRKRPLILLEPGPYHK